MNVTQTSNILMATFGSFTGNITFTVSYMGDPKLKPCLIRLACNYCTDATACEETAELTNVFETQDVTLAGTRLQYRCSIAELFDGYDEFQVLEAQWDGTWLGGTTIRTCVGMKSNSLLLEKSQLIVKREKHHKKNT